MYYPIGHVFTKDPQVLKQFYNVFWIVLVMQPLCALAFIFDGMFKGLSKMKDLRNLLIFSTFLVFLPLLYFFDQNNLKSRIKNFTDTLLIHGDADQVVPSTHLLEAKDFLIRNNVDVETLLIKNCDHHIPMEASSTALNYILKKN